MFAFIITVYLILCLFVGLLTRGTRMGYWGGVAFSVVITPFLMYILIALIAPRQVS
ncbi:hypothetical protein [Breoghania sp. L-A4]|uniref:hypothetical protein n=1 Tax=Breoghania sp. L-A4 TaxID=2304600 RepID=UPI0013C2C254|nr:hypothetical protein [Breoghania sp. L-A4]